MSNIENFKVEWKRYTKKTNWTQWFNCQQFGHSQANSNNKSRWDKCYNCKEAHKANYTNCPKLLDNLQRRHPRPHPHQEPLKTTITVIPTNIELIHTIEFYGPEDEKLQEERQRS